MQEILNNNFECAITFPEALWKGVSVDAKELVALMTASDPLQRVSIDQARANAWFTKDFKQAPVLSSALEHMKHYCHEYDASSNHP
jgi:hypothetical protein